MRCECGKNITTPFCPQCGRSAITTAPLLSLLAYVRQHGAWARRNHEERIRNQGYDEAPRQSVTRWTEWEKALLEFSESSDK